MATLLLRRITIDTSIHKVILKKARLVLKLWISTALLWLYYRANRRGVHFSSVWWPSFLDFWYYSFCLLTVVSDGLIVLRWCCLRLSLSWVTLFSRGIGETVRIATIVRKVGRWIFNWSSVGFVIWIRTICMLLANLPRTPFLVMLLFCRVICIVHLLLCWWAICMACNLVALNAIATAWSSRLGLLPSASTVLWFFCCWTLVVVGAAWAFLLGEHTAI